MSEKSKGKIRQEELSYRKKNYFEEADEKERKAIFAYAEGYKAFLDAAKTEREACDYSVAAAKKAGFTEYRFGDPLKAGDKKYFVNRGKSIVVFRIGKKNLEEDEACQAAHIGALVERQYYEIVAVALFVLDVQTFAGHTAFDVNYLSRFFGGDYRLMPKQFVGYCKTVQIIRYLVYHPLTFVYD